MAMMLGHVKIVNPCYFIATRGKEGIGEGWDWGRIWDWWVLDRQIEEPLWHGGGRECGTGKGATRGKGVGPTR